MYHTNVDVDRLTHPLPLYWKCFVAAEIVSINSSHRVKRLSNEHQRLKLFCKSAAIPKKKTPQKHYTQYQMKTSFGPPMGTLGAAMTL